MASGDWNNAANWNPAVVPNNTADTATIANGGTATLNTSATFTPNSVNLGGSASGTLNVSLGTIQVPERFRIGFGGGSGLVNLSAGGKLVSQRPAGVGFGDEDFHIGDSGPGRLEMSGGEVFSGDDVLIGHLSNGVWNMTGGAVTGAGFTVVGDEDGSSTPSGLQARGQWNLAAGSITQSFGDLECGDEGLGVINISGGTMSLTGILAVGNRGLGTGICNISGGQLTVPDISLGRGYDSGANSRAYGAMNVSGGSLNVTNILEVGGSGVGVLRVIGSEATINTLGMFMESGPVSEGTLCFEIDSGGVTTIQADSADLLGTLSMGAVPGYAPPVGSTFTLISANSLVNTGLTLDPANAGVWSFSANGTTLSATYLGLPGDGNQDGSISGADFTIWADNFGTGSTLGTGDYNGDHMVTGADFTIWADNFGRTLAKPAPITDVMELPEGGYASPAEGPTALVPEPSSIVLGLLAAVGLLVWRKGR